MSDLGQARPASHENLSAKFGGLLTRVETPAPAQEPTSSLADLDDTSISKIPGNTDAAPTGSAVPAATESDATDAEKPKKSTRRKTANQRETQKSSEAAPTAERREAEKMPEVAHENVNEGKADQPVQISLPSSLEKRLAKFKTTTGLSHPNILFDALESTADQLAALVKANTVQLGSATGVSLFSRPQTAVKRDAANEPKKTFIIRITKQNKDILDDLVKRVEAPNRNLLIVTAYDTYLPTD